jgi:hypothetical protein
MRNFQNKVSLALGVSDVKTFWFSCKIYDSVLNLCSFFSNDLIALLQALDAKRKGKA